VNRWRGGVGIGTVAVLELFSTSETCAKDSNCRASFKLPYIDPLPKPIIVDQSSLAPGAGVVVVGSPYGLVRTELVAHSCLLNLFTWCA
jgi:hypothetical protein